MNKLLHANPPSHLHVLKGLLLSLEIFIFTTKKLVSNGVQKQEAFFFSLRKRIA